MRISCCIGMFSLRMRFQIFRIHSLHVLAIRGNSLCEKDVRLATSVGIGHHTRNDKTEFLIKLVWVAAQVSDLCQMVKDIGVKINPCKGCHIVLIIGSHPNCQTPSFSDEVLKRHAQAAVQFHPLVGSVSQPMDGFPRRSHHSDSIHRSNRQSRRSGQGRCG